MQSLYRKRGAMEHRFQSIRVRKPYCIREHKHTPMCQDEQFWEVEAIEYRGSGLAIERVWYQPSWEGYGVVHIASGRLLLLNTVPTLVEAGLWLRRIAGLCDWTQPSRTLIEQPEVKEQVYFAWLDTMHDCHLLRQGEKLLTTSYQDYLEAL